MGNDEAERQDLRERLRASRHVVEIARVLLSYCRSHAPEILTADNDVSNVELYIAVYEEASDLFEDMGETLGETEKERVAELLLSGEPPLHVRAWALALALDDACHRFFPGFFRDRGTVRLKAGDVYPVGYPDYRSSLGTDRLISSPASLPTRPDQLPHLRLSREEDVSRFDIEFDFRVASQLASLAGPEAPRFATCHPNVSADELAFPEPDQDGCFFGVKPEDSERQSAIASKLLAKVIELGATIVVFPELAMDEVGWERLENQFRADDDSGPLLLVAGSCHLESGSARRNLSLGWVKGFDGSFGSQKFWPYKYRVGKEVFTEGIRREDRAKLAVLSTGSWSCSIVICRDLLDSERANVMIRLGINLLLVPAMSPKLGTFEGRISGHVAGTQGFVALANSPLTWNRPQQEEVSYSGDSMHSGSSQTSETALPAALFGQPIVNALLVRIIPARRERTPGIAFLDPRTDSSGWHPVPI